MKLKEWTATILKSENFSILPQRGSYMQYLSFQKFSKSPQAALSSLSKDGKVVLTTKGKPSAFLIKTNDKDFEKLYNQLLQLEALQAITDMQEISKKNGNSKMSLKEINKLISDARKSK